MLFFKAARDELVGVNQGCEMGYAKSLQAASDTFFFADIELINNNKLLLFTSHSQMLCQHGILIKYKFLPEHPMQSNVSYWDF